LTGREVESVASTAINGATIAAEFGAGKRGLLTRESTGDGIPFARI
jgi:hypothetical protein